MPYRVPKAEAHHQQQRQHWQTVAEGREYEAAGDIERYVKGHGSKQRPVLIVYQRQGYAHQKSVYHPQKLAVHKAEYRAGYKYGGGPFEHPPQSSVY